MNETFKKYLMKYAGIGAGLSLGFVASALLAVTISGTINTFASGDQLDATKINENFASLKTAVEGVSSHEAVRVRNSTIISIPNNSDTALTFDTEDFDSASMHSVTSQTSRLTAITSGIYILCGDASFAENSTGVRAWKIRVNGTTEIARSIVPTSDNSNSTELTICTTYRFQVGEYAELIARQNSGSSINIYTLPNYSPSFTMTKLSN